MPGTLTNIGNFINSPPGQLVAGGVLAGIVWKFFERVEAVLTDDTKLEIAVWLLGIRTTASVSRWPKTFLAVFDRVFGAVHPSWRGFRRATVASLLLYGIVIAPLMFHDRTYLEFSLPPNLQRLLASLGFRIAFIFLGSVVAALIMAVPEYISLVITRRIILTAASTLSLTVKLLAVMLAAFLAAQFVAFLSLVSSFYSLAGPEASLLLAIRQGFHYTLHNLVTSSAATLLGNLLTSLPLFFGTAWLVLYGLSGFALKAARRFDIGFDWFNRKFDIEHKPLQAIGLVSGSIVAAIYWGVALGASLMKK